MPGNGTPVCPAFESAGEHSMQAGIGGSLRHVKIAGGVAECYFVWSKVESVPVDVHQSLYCTF